MRRLPITLICGMGVALGVAGGVIVHQHRLLSELQQQRDTALQSLKENREALRQNELRLTAALQEKPIPENSNKAILARRNAAIQQLTSELNDAKASITQLQASLSASRDENEKALKNSDQNLQQTKTELNGRLEQMQRQLTGAEADLQRSRQRIATLEQQNDQLSAANNEGVSRTAEREHILAQLQDIDRRRESYLTTIADRYRNVTNQFRTMSGMLDSSHGRDSTNFSGTALDMIQNAISLTDTDLHHLSELNAKAFRLEKQLSKRK